MKLTRRQKNAIDKLAGGSPVEIAQNLGLETSTVSNYLGIIQNTDQSKSTPTIKPANIPPGTPLNEIFVNFLNGNRPGLIIILLTGFVIYISSLTNLPVSDDKPLMDILGKGNYLSVVLKEPVNAIVNSLTYTMNYIVGGTNPLGYHLVNIVLHLLVSLAIYFFLYIITNRRVAFLATLVFAVTTVHSESVIWISGRHYILYSLFCILALTFYTYYTENKERPFYYFCSVGFFITAIYSFPEQSIILPLLLPLLDFCRGHLRKGFKLYLAFFLLSALFALLSLNRVQERVLAVAGDSLTSNNNGWGFLITDATAIYSYLKLFIIPVGLSFYHETIPVSTINLVAYFLTSLGFLALPILFFKKNKLVLFSVGFFIITLLPTLTPMKVSWAVAERYTYLGILGPAIILALLVDWLLNIKLVQRAAVFAFLLIIILWSTMTFLRGFDWKNEDSLWLATVKASPDSSKAWNNMGDYYGRHGDMTSSFNSFVRATQLNPTYSDAWHNAGNVLMQSGKMNEAILYLERSLQFNPNLVEAYNKLAFIYHRQENQTKSLEMVRRSLEINPGRVDTYILLATLEYENRNLEKSREAIRKGLEVDPQNRTLLKDLPIIETEIDAAKTQKQAGN